MRKWLKSWIASVFWFDFLYSVSWWGLPSFPLRIICMGDRPDISHLVFYSSGQGFASPVASGLPLWCSLPCQSLWELSPQHRLQHQSSSQCITSAPPSMAPELCLNPASVVGVLPAYLDLIRTSWWLKIGSEVRLPRLESQSHHLFVTCGSCCLTFLHLWCLINKKGK